MNSTLLVYSDGQLNVWEPATIQSLWGAPVAIPFQPRFLLSDVERFVLATPFEIFAVDRRTGAVAWRMPVALGTGDPADLVDTVRWRHFAATADSVIAIDTSGHLTCLDAESGGRRWRSQFDDDVVPNLLGCNQRAAYCVSTIGDEMTLFAYALAKGNRLYSTTIAMAGNTGPFFVTPHGPVISTDSRLIAFDVETNHIRWQFRSPKPIIRRLFSKHDKTAYWLDAAGEFTALDLQTGAARWHVSEPVIAGAEWLVVVSGGKFIIAGKPGMLVCVDSETGQVIWRHSGRTWPFAQPPVKVGGDILVSYRLPNDMRPDPQIEAHHRFRIIRIACKSGMALPAIVSGDVITEPINQWGGIFARNNTLLLLDGRRLIGYVSTRSRR